ncbi:DNA polymerase I, partial [Enterobacter kobei]
KAEVKKEVAYLSYKLAKIHTDVESELGGGQLEVQRPSADELLSLFKKDELERWTTDVEAGTWLQAKGAKPAAKPKGTIVVDAEVQAEEEGTVLSFDNCA